jgi:GNAT superfamily N-acetyltransferase
VTEIVPYEPAQLDAVLGLMAKVYGERPPRDEFGWWFDGNPVGPRTVVLATEGEAVAGVLGASCYRAVVDGEEALVALPLYAATDPAFQGRGIFQRLNAEVERVARDAGARLELGFTNREAGPIYVSKLGWLEVNRLRVWARPLLPFGRSESGDLETFGRDQEDAYRRIAPKLRSHFVRSAEYLNWRYVDSPREYAVIASPNGYAVVGRKRLRGVAAAFVADLVAPSVREAHWLLRRSARVARGARVLVAVPHLHSAAYAAFGFVPTLMTIRLIGHALDGHLPIGPGAWRFSLGDTDFF